MSGLTTRDFYVCTYPYICRAIFDESDRIFACSTELICETNNTHNEAQMREKDIT